MSVETHSCRNRRRLSAWPSAPGSLLGEGSGPLAAILKHYFALEHSLIRVTITRVFISCFTVLPVTKIILVVANGLQVRIPSKGGVSGTRGCSFAHTIAI